MDDIYYIGKNYASPSADASSSTVSIILVCGIANQAAEETNSYQTGKNASIPVRSLVKSNIKGYILFKVPRFSHVLGMASCIKNLNVLKAADYISE